MRQKKAIANIISSLIYQVVSVVCALIVPRLILSSFGSTYNGVIQSATQLLSIISILTLGIAGATRVALYKSLAANDTLATSRIVKANNQYMNKVGLILTVYVALLAFVYPYISNNTLSNLDNAKLILIVSISIFSEYFLGITYRTLLMAAQREYVYSILMAVARILNAIVIYVLVKAGASVFAVLLFGTIVMALVPVILYIYSNKRFSLIKNCTPDREALSQRRAAAFHSLANIIHQNTDITLLTLFTDAMVISVYSVYFLIASKMRMIVQMFTGGLEAAFGEMWVRKEKESFEKNFSAYEFLIYSIASVIFPCLGLLLVPFVRLYTVGITDINYIHYPFAVLLTIAEAMFCIREPYLTIVQATGNYQATKNVAIAEAVINIVSSLIFVYKFGLIGVVIGTILANSYRTICYAYFTYKNVLLDRTSRIIKRAIYLACNVTVGLVLSRFVFNYLRFETWGQWIVGAFVVFLMFTIIVIINSFLFFKDDLRCLIYFAKRAICR